MALNSALTLLALTLFSPSAAARTDLSGCTSFTSTVTVRPEPGYGNTDDSIIWYVPDSLEICEGVDCGGGRAPPKSVPGCPLYEGTETVTPRFLEEDSMKATAGSTMEESPTATGKAEEEEEEEEEDKEKDKEKGETDEQNVESTSSFSAFLCSQ